MENTAKKQAIKLLRGEKIKEKYSLFCKLYAFTTENIGGYYKKIHLKNKTILTVCGSADHVMNAILLGSKEIDCFDINYLSYYFLELKISAVKTLNYEEFLEYFLLYDGNQNLNKSAMNYSSYQKIKEELKRPIQSFWDTLYKAVDFNGFDIRNSELFNNLYDTNEKKYKSNLYINKKSFQKLKKQIYDCNIHFISSSLLDLESKLKDKKYDVIFLSNISDYLSSMFQIDLLENYKEKIINPLMKHLLKNGLITFIYQYDSGNGKRSVCDNDNFIKQIFQNSKKIEFDSVLGEEKIDAIWYMKEE